MNPDPTPAASELRPIEREAADYMERTMADRFDKRVGKALHAAFGNAPGEYLAAMYGVRGYVAGHAAASATESALREALSHAAYSTHGFKPDACSACAQVESLLAPSPQ